MKVSVGIPAYNEEANIEKLILALLEQSEEHIQLKEIIIVSDQSSDNTAEIVHGIPSSKIIFIENKKRLGQALSQNVILSTFSGDALVLLNADTLPSNKHFLADITEPLRNDKNIGLVASKVVALPAQNLLQTILTYSTKMKTDLFEQWNKGKNIYTCVGRSRALSKAFAKQLEWPSIVTEDAYSYLSCKDLEFTYFYTKKAAVFYQLPATLSDHMKQSSRFFAGTNELNSIFSTTFVKSEYSIPRSLALKTALLSLFKNPALFISYILIVLYVKAKTPRDYSPAIAWEASKSSKRLERSS